MIEATKDLLGARVRFVGFGVAHFTIELSDETRAYSISTSADVSLNGNDPATEDFREANSVGSLPNLLDAELTAIRIDDECRSGVLEFDNGIHVRTWWPDKIYDNLFIVRDAKGDAWRVLG